MDEGGEEEGVEAARDNGRHDEEHGTQEADQAELDAQPESDNRGDPAGVRSS